MLYNVKKHFKSLHFVQLSKVILSDREELALDIADLAGRVWSTL